MSQIHGLGEKADYSSPQHQREVRELALVPMGVNRETAKLLAIPDTLNSNNELTHGLERGNYDYFTAAAGNEEKLYTSYLDKLVKFANENYRNLNGSFGDLCGIINSPDFMRTIYSSDLMNSNKWEAPKWQAFTKLISSFSEHEQITGFSYHEQPKIDLFTEEKKQYLKEQIQSKDSNITGDDLGTFFETLNKISIKILDTSHLTKRQRLAGIDNNIRAVDDEDLCRAFRINVMDFKMRAHLHVSNPENFNHIFGLFMDVYEKSTRLSEHQQPENDLFAEELKRNLTEQIQLEDSGITDDDLRTFFETLNKISRILDTNLLIQYQTIPDLYQAFEGNAKDFKRLALTADQENFNRIFDLFIRVITPPKN